MTAAPRQGRAGRGGSVADTLSKDLKRISQLEDATRQLGTFKRAIGLGGLFMIGVLVFTLTLGGTGNAYWFVVVAGVRNNFV